MSRVVALVLALVCSAAVLLSAQPAAPSIRLVLLIAVDQFRYDYLTRFRADYTSGLKQLLDGGAVFTDANLEHYPTVTAIGHATMLSGATPSVSGIIGNDWFDRETGVNVQSITDNTVKPLGAETAPLASPRRMLASTVGDELKLTARGTGSTSAAPRVIGISLKDRAAILPVGRGADAAYWWDTKSGRFVSSTYYFDDVPAWVHAFNEKKRADAVAGQAWASLSNPATILKQMPKEVGGPLFEAVYGSAFGNELLMDFADEVLTREQLGQRGVTDVLTVSFSSNDSVGHTFGPSSPQVRDLAIRTDRTIGRLLARVGALVGARNTLVAFTTDHGVGPIPEEMQKQRLPGGRMTSKELSNPIEMALRAKFGEGKWVAGMAGSSPYLNYDLISKMQLDPAEVRRVAAEAVAAVPHVARVYTRDQLLRGEVAADRIGQRVLRGFYAPRSGDLEVILEPYWMRQATGTTHGSPYNYDAHIPLILMGRRIKPGEYSNHVALNDLAPTIATILGIEIPSGSSGRVLAEAIRPATPETVQSTR